MIRVNPADNRPEDWVLATMEGIVQGRYPNPGPLYGGMTYPGRGYPQNPGQDRPGLSPFGRMAKDQGLGKKSILNYNASTQDEQPSAVSVLQVEGDDLDATQMVITIAPPMVIPLSQASVLAESARIGAQNVSGEQDNSNVTGDDFPGTVAPISWPPIEAVIEWGVGGTSSKMIVDITNGCTIPVVASFVRVHAVVTQGSTSGEIVGTSALYVVSAWIGPGLASSTSAPKRTVFLGTVAPNTESDVFAVPTFARRAYIIGQDTASPPNVTVAYLRFWQSPDGSAGGNNVGNLFVSANQPQAFNIPNAGQYFTIFNSSVSMKFAVIFELDP